MTNQILPITTHLMLHLMILTIATTSQPAAVIRNSTRALIATVRAKGNPHLIFGRSPVAMTFLVLKTTGNPLKMDRRPRPSPRLHPSEAVVEMAPEI